MSVCILIERKTRSYIKVAEKVLNAIYILRRLKFLDVTRGREDL
jgi:hypothetical protein